MRFLPLPSPGGELHVEHAHGHRGSAAVVRALVDPDERPNALQVDGTVTLELPEGTVAEERPVTISAEAGMIPTSLEFALKEEEFGLWVSISILINKHALNVDPGDRARASLFGPDSPHLPDRFQLWRRSADSFWSRWPVRDVVDGVSP